MSKMSEPWNLMFRKGHSCEFKGCNCNLCNLNNERRKINNDLRNNRKMQVTESSRRYVDFFQ